MNMDIDILKEKLHLATSDMCIAELFWKELRNVKSDGFLKDAIKIACITTYSRPFTTSLASDGRPNKWLKQYNFELLEYLERTDPRLAIVHGEIIAERDQLVAHPDSLHHQAFDRCTIHSDPFSAYSADEFIKTLKCVELFLAEKLHMIGGPRISRSNDINQ